MPTEGQSGEMPNEGGAGQEQGEMPDFAAWLDSQPESVKTLVSGKIERLHGDLHTERQQRKEFANQLKDLTKRAEKGSELEKALGETSTRLEQAEQRAAFYEDAGKPEIGCTNPKAAFLVAQADGLFTKRGDPDWAAIKAAAPELFAGRKTPPGNAGTGNGAPAPKGGTMNDYIRAAAGRG